jgi:hypothetical protein
VFTDGLTLPEFVGGPFLKKIEQILDPTLAPIEVFIIRWSNVTFRKSEVCVTMHDCLVSAIRVALNCCSQAPHQRLGMRMQRQSCAWLMMLVFVPLFNKISVNVVSWSSVAWLCVAVE